jgi:DNA-binding NarL/FixJ family response regulator
VSVTSLHRVLVVEDHAPFRRVICKLLQQRADLQIVGEAVDGWDAVCQAEALRPDVVLLDIGLPRLSGIEAAGRIRALIPDAKVMFVTIESSLEIVEQAFSRGAHGYVYKPRAVRDLLPVLDAILRGAQFVSGGLERVAQGDSLAAHHHPLLFYSSDAALVGACSGFIAGAFAEGHAVIVLVTKAHEESIRLSLQASCIDFRDAVQQGRYISVDICDMLAKVTVDGWPDPVRFRSAAEDLVAAARRAARHGARVVACGECAPTLWAQGRVQAAIRLEHLWDELVQSQRMDTLCMYPSTARETSLVAMRSLCAEHTSVEIR